VLDYESVKKKYKTIENNKKYRHTFHLHNAYLTSFSYLTFENKLDFSEILMILLVEEAKFMECFREEEIFHISYFEPHPEGLNSTQKDLDVMKFMMNDVIRMSNDCIGENCWNDHRNREENDGNDIIIGYYLNNQWKSNYFPQEYINKIFSADKYITLFNEKSEIAIVMEHSGKQSLFYSLNDQ